MDRDPRAPLVRDRLTPEERGLVRVDGSAFADDGDTIEGRWETSPDGREWQLDFRLTYWRIREGGER